MKGISEPLLPMAIYTICQKLSLEEYRKEALTWLGSVCKVKSYLSQIINSLIKVKTLLYKIPPNLPLPKGGIIPLFGKEGRGEIF
jgi:hypothetical protein